MATDKEKKPKESARQTRKKAGDYKDLVAAAGRQGVDLNSIDQSPLMDSDKDKITSAIRNAYPKELAEGITNIASSYTAPKNEQANKIDLKRLMEDQKRIRRARFADSLYAFGEGLQGKGVNPEAWATTRLTRQRDKEFQDFKDTTERNQKTKYLWENQTRKELVDWADEQSQNMRLDEREREKFKMLADQYKQSTEFKNRDFTERERHNKAMEKRPTGSGKLSKDEKPVIVQTAKKTYTLKPEEASLMYGEAIGNPEVQNLHPDWFEKTAETELQKDKYIQGKTVVVPTGRFTYKLKTGVDKTALVRALLELSESSELNDRRDFTSNIGKNKYLNQYKTPVAAQPKPAQKPQQKQTYSKGGLY